MNGKNFATLSPAIATVAPPLIIIGGLVALAAWLLSGTDKKEPEKAQEKAVPLPNPLNSGGNSAQNAHIPANSAPVASKIPAQPGIPLSAQKKFIVRADMANIFNGGTCRLTRTAAVSALKALGFGKTAAYAALSPDGRFCAWLQCAPDGTITWKC